MKTIKQINKEIEELSLCRFCGCMTKSIESYKEIMHPYKLITFLICGKCKLPKDNTQEIEQKDKKQDNFIGYMANTSNNSPASPSDIEDELKLGYFKTGYGQGIQKATDDILLLIDDCRKGLLTNQQADILHVKICKLSQIQKK
jgi:hypothetical protein